MSLDRNIVLRVIGEDGVERPGYVIRAGDYITETQYRHDQRLMVVRVGTVPLTLRQRVRRWWEGRR